jgi:pilus assembly protein Flp/PilA
MKDAISIFLRDEEGATAIEYGIIAGAMAVLLVAIFSPSGTLSGALTGVFSRIATALGGPAATAPVTGG